MRYFLALSLPLCVLKRYFGVKDSGQIIPGHGGALDRFDGIDLKTQPDTWNGNSNLRKKV